MQVNTIVKLRNPQLNFQKDIRYKVTKVNKTTVHCRVVEYDKVSESFKDVHYGKDYRNQKISLFTSVSIQ